MRSEKPEDEQAVEYEYEEKPGEPPEVDPEVPEADALEQRSPVRPESGRVSPSVEGEANEADVLEQSESVGDDEEDAWE